MKTTRLLEALPRFTTRGDLPAEVTGLQYDSRRTGTGDVFVCLEGLTSDGHRFAAQAAAQGAGVVVARREPDPAVSVPLRRPYASVP